MESLRELNYLIRYTEPYLLINNQDNLNEEQVKIIIKIYNKNL
jgi:hypothetical protein